MNQHWELIPEGEADRVLLQVLGYAKPNNGTGIGNVLNKINTHFPGRFALGVVDNDDRKPKLFDQFQLIKSENSLELHQRQQPNFKHFLIVVCPAMEDWLVENARLANIELPSFGFENRKRFQQLCKDDSIGKNAKFRQFLHRLRQTPGLVTMSNWINELYQKHL